MGSTEDAEDVQGTADSLGVSAADINDKVINKLVETAEEIADADGDAHHTWLDIEREPLRNAMCEAVGTAYTAVLSAKSAAEETATLTQRFYGQQAQRSNPMPRRRYVLAAHAAAGLVVDADKIIPGPTLALTDAQRIRGASEWVHWWAFTFASSVARLPEFPDTPRRLAVEQRFFKSLARLPRDHPAQRESTMRVLVDYLTQLATDEFTTDETTDTDPVTEPSDTDPVAESVNPDSVVEPTNPHPVVEPSDAYESRPAVRQWWWSSVNALHRVIVALTVAFLAAAGGLLVIVNRDDGNAVERAIVTPQALPTPVPAVFNAPVLADASLQLFGYPEKTPLDPSVQAVPDHPAQHPVTVDVGKEFIVEIRLMKSANQGLDPTENFFLGFWTSALIKPLSEKTTMTPPNSAEKDAPPLNRYPDTMVEDLETKVPIIFKIPVVAIPQMETDGPPDKQYNCGFNATQFVNVLLASSSHTIPVVTTLPVSVRRTEGCR